MAECSYCGNTQFGMVRFYRGFRVYCSRRCQSLHTASYFWSRIAQLLRDQLGRQA